MNNITEIWKSSKSITKYIVVGAGVLSIILGSIGYYFYSDFKEKEAARIEKENKQNKEKNDKSEISNFYEKELKGSGINGFISWMLEMDSSRYLMELTGFKETFYSVN